jgi:hypothetical protein
MPTLPDRDQRVLALAAATHRHESDRERAVWSELQLTLPVFYAHVNRLLSSEAAEAHDPIAVHRLRRVREMRRR